MPDWKEESFGSIFKVKHGYAFKGEFFTDSPQRYALVTPGNFAIGGGFQSQKKKYYSGPVPNEYVLMPGAVVVTMTDLSKQSDTLGYASLVPDDGTTWLHNQRVGLLEFHDQNQADPVFFSYLMRTRAYRTWVVGSATGTSVKHTAPSRIESFRCLVPTVQEQRKIGTVLKSIDDKIDLNHRVNQTLEAMAQAIFKSWFVDFDPIKAKIAAIQQGCDPLIAAMTAISGKSDAELDALPPEQYEPLAATAALFPEEIEESELGEIPRGWAVLAADSLTEVGIGKTPPRKEHQWFTEGQGDWRWVSIKDMGASGVFQQRSSEFLTSEAVSRFNVRVVPGRTVLLSFKLTIGRVAITDGPMVTNEAIAHFKLPSDALISSEYLYLYLKGFDYSTLGSTSSIADAVNSKTIREMPITVASRALIDRFTKSVTPLFEEMRNRQNEIASLGATRDALLPKLLSGEIEVAA